MKNFDEITLEETMVKFNSQFRFTRKWEIFLGVFLIVLVLYGILKHENTAFIISIPIWLISPQILQSNLNAQAIVKLYEKIKKDDKNN